MFKIYVSINKSKQEVKEIYKIIPAAFGALLMPIPLTAGLPITPSNLIRQIPSSFTKALKSTNCNALLAPTAAKISKSERTCWIRQEEEL